MEVQRKILEKVENFCKNVQKNPLQFARKKAGGFNRLQPRFLLEFEARMNACGEITVEKSSKIMNRLARSTSAAWLNAENQLDESLLIPYEDYFYWMMFDPGFQRKVEKEEKARREKEERRKREEKENARMRHTMMTAGKKKKGKEIGGNPKGASRKPTRRH